MLLQQFLNSVSEKEILYWTNVCFIEHEYFKTVLGGFWMNYKLCELLLE